MSDDTIKVKPDFFGIAQSLGRVEGNLKGINTELRDIKENDQKQWEHIEENTKNISAVEKTVDEHIIIMNTEKEVKEAFYKRHPIKTAIGGAIGGTGVLGTVITFIVYIVLKLDEAGVLP